MRTVIKPGHPVLMNVLEKLAKAANQTLHIRSYDDASQTPGTLVTLPHQAKEAVSVVDTGHRVVRRSYRRRQPRNDPLSSFKRNVVRRDRENTKHRIHRVRAVGILRKRFSSGKARAFNAAATHANKERARIRRRARASRMHKEDAAYVTAFLKLNPDIQLKSHLLSSDQMDWMIAKLLDSKAKSIVDNLHGFTMREAFVDQKLYASVYIWLARDDGVTNRPGQSFAECERFLLKDPRPTLVNGETGERYRAGDQSFKSIELVSFALATFDTACACSEFETKLQRYFDARRFGSARLWKQTGAGRLYQKLRRCDIRAIESTGNRAPVFTCGISYVNHVRIQSMSHDLRITSIRSGIEGQLSRVQPPPTGHLRDTICRANR